MPVIFHVHEWTFQFVVATMKCFKTSVNYDGAPASRRKPSLKLDGQNLGMMIVHVSLIHLTSSKPDSFNFIRL